MRTYVATGENNAMTWSEMLTVEEEVRVDVRNFALQIAKQRSEERPTSLILFLGVECARAAKVPGIEVIARQVFNALSQKNSEMVKTLLPEWDKADESLLVQAFRELLGGMSGGQRYNVLQSFYNHIPVPLFYQDLAVLIRMGYFNRILTTNIDTLLEEALNGVGLRAGSEYEVINLGEPIYGKRSSLRADIPGDSIKIIKLHGDLGLEGSVTPRDISAALKPQDSFTENELKADIIMVGYEFESRPLESWLAETPGGTLWWVSPERPDPWQVYPMRGSRRVAYIDNPLNGGRMDAETFFEAFFGTWAFQLLRLPVLELMTESRGHASQIAQTASSGKTAMPTGAAFGDEYLKSQYWQSQLRRCREVLYRLQQETFGGPKSVELQTQIEYQKRKIIEFEDAIRSLSLSENNPRLVALMEQIAGSVEQADIDQATVDYLRTQINVVKKECSQHEPNQNIISASISATLAIAERLGRQAVKLDLLSELTAFAHQVIGWEV